MERIWMKFGKPLLLWTLITMVPTVFEKNHFKGYLSQSIISRCWKRLLDSRMWPWTQNLCAGSIFDPEHDGPRVSRKFETFGKFRNKVWVPPVKSENFRLKSTNGFVEGTVGKFNVASIQNQSSKLRAYRNLKLSLISSYQFIMGVENFTVCYTPEKLWFQCNCVLAMS